MRVHSRAVLPGSSRQLVPKAASTTQPWSDTWVPSPVGFVGLVRARSLACCWSLRVTFPMPRRGVSRSSSPRMGSEACLPNWPSLFIAVLEVTPPQALRSCPQQGSVCLSCYVAPGAPLSGCSARATLPASANITKTDIRRTLMRFNISNSHPFRHLRRSDCCLRPP
jgi:hypothetical protein